MTQQFETQLDAASAWKRFQGQTVAGIFPLQEYLGGSDHSAVFLTYIDSPEPAKAAIKLVQETPEKTKLQLSRWELAANFSHPNLLRLFQSGRCRLGDTNLLYAVMEYADEDLSQIVPQRALSAEEAEQMLPPVVDAVAYVHSKGLVHGHIKPSNIMACGDHVKLSSDTICETGEPLTAPDAHDAPESIASVAGDIWSLGAAIVEVLTQRLPQPGSRGAGQMEIPQTVSAPFSDIAYGCLQLEPKRRWKLAEIRSRLQPGIAPSSQPETNTTQAAAKRQLPAQEVSKQEIRSLKQESRVLPLQKQARPLPAKQTHKRSYAVPIIGIALLLIVLVAGPIVLRHRMAASPQSPVSESAQTAPETTATEQLPPAEPAAKLERPAPAATSSTSLEQVPEKVEKPASEETSPERTSAASTSAPTATPPENAPSPASDTPTDQRSAGVSDSQPGNGVLHEALPVVLDKARDSIRGTVRVNVKVTVDASGNVQQAELNAAGPSKYFANLALQSAQKFTFEPAPNDGGAPREWNLRFEFTNAGTKILAARANP